MQFLSLPQKDNNGMKRASCSEIDTSFNNIFLFNHTPIYIHLFCTCKHVAKTIVCFFKVPQKNKVAGAKNCLPQLKSAKESNIKLTPNQEQILEQTKMSKRELESCNMHLFQLQFASFLFLYMACSVWSLFLLGVLALSIPFLPFCHFSIIFFFSLPDPH